MNTYVIFVIKIIKINQVYKNTIKNTIQKQVHKIIIMMYTNVIKMSTLVMTIRKLMNVSIVKNVYLIVKVDGDMNKNVN